MQLILFSFNVPQLLEGWIALSSEQITISLDKYYHNLVPRAFLRRGEEGREKTLASADHVIFSPFLSSAEKSPGDEVGIIKSY